MSTQTSTGSSQYDAATTETGRHAGQVVLLLVGHSGHGKSTMVNRLLGTDLLDVAEDGPGPTTKVIQRVEVEHTSTQSGVTVNIAFDDTPGDSDTGSADGVVNSDALDVYKSRHFPDTGGASENSIYLNVILLVVSWDSVVEDAHNAPDYFTSAAGKTMQALSSSGLVDHSRPNVVVVVTKSMSSWDDLVDDEEDSGLDPRASWMLEAKTRKDIIVGLQRQILPWISAAWDVVFVEHGRTRDAAYPRLPNGEWSHPNLFDAISKLIRRPGVHGREDFAGMHALDFLTGVAVEESLAQIETRVPITQDDLIVFRAQSRASVSAVLRPSRYQANLEEQQIAKRFLGVTYNPLSGTFG
ncbi:hypothetical protein R3P38DRAFT_2564931 [Favolaschia claudopus]|uniref:G domain-containing protein n=1 Tax=Favolaschia claudopus TaxID=2862362 RepID=A0AAW0A0C1_9AGAR